ncbi:C45 family autoproteolytic acyltransferase/hydolase [Candidatus Contubernalis alkaliaceticus]|uniref:C45 family autoproteolytic acyltransferase/hydolase n=1 Tax=Candidatus Contubernalis alkaliaceticus TaxID=338645 RepID=UPI001F4C0E5B|nr:C45 family peptidase [Candidatus Contubernalis alkalaceticus]UNC91329.1 hypothetical protein HUE98_04030 [Candidatus Contubernalis alkalaceticus]
MKQEKSFKVIECSGTPYEIGQQYGEACRDNIKKSLEMNLYGLSAFYNASRQDVTANTSKFLPRVRDFDPYLIEMLKGQAKGAGLNFEEVFSLRCMSELLIYYNQISALCTSFAASGKAVEDGKTMLGQTIDWTPDTPLDLLRIRHADGLVQLSLVIGSFVEYTISSTGFGMCANATFGMDYSFNIPLGCYLPKAMRQKNINEALEVLKEAARGLGYYHLASAEGEMVGIESVHNDFEILTPEQDMMVHSNHYLTERFKERDMASQAIPDSFFRIERIEKLMNESLCKLTPQVMMEIMRDHENHPNSICKHVDISRAPVVSETLAAFVMVPVDQKMYIAYGNPCNYEFVEYKL